MVFVPPPRYLLRARDFVDLNYARDIGMTPTEYRAEHPPAVSRVVVPMCVQQAHGRPKRRTFREDAGGDDSEHLDETQYRGQHRGRITMKFATAQVWVLDQDEALEFYTEKLGFEVREDVTVPELDNFRWLTVAPPDQGEVAIALMAIPGEPVFDDETVRQIKDLVSKGRATGVFFTTDDIHREYEELRARGVEFVEEPTERPYGIDCGFRDPFGNHFRLSQLVGAFA